MDQERKETLWIDWMEKIISFKPMEGFEAKTFIVKD